MPTRQVDEFINALQERNNSRMKTLLEADPSLAEAINKDGVSLLMLSCYHRNKEMADLILTMRPPADIYEAAATGDIKALSSMVSLDPASINSFYADGFTPLGLAVYFRHSEAARLLIMAGADSSLPSNNSFRVTPLHSAAATGNTELARLLISHGAEVNSRQSSGVTALHSAAHIGNLDMSRLLVIAGADVHATTDGGKTAFDYALEAGFEHVANYLQRKAKQNK
jgi:ankyrin repeat protein